MRVSEGVQVYRAKLNGGSAPLTLSADLKRGSYSYASLTSATSTATAAASLIPEAPQRP